MKLFTGKVVFKKDDKTAKVAVDRVVSHPIYKKRYTLTKNYAVHDEIGSKIDDTVKFVASKPYSKTKKWKIVEIVGEGSKKTKTKKGTKSKKQAAKKDTTTNKKTKTKKGGSKAKAKAK